jgi:hypothetical protein
LAGPQRAVGGPEGQLLRTADARFQLQLQLRLGPALYVPVRCLNVLNDAAKYVWVILSERNPNVPIEIKRESNQLYSAVASRPDIDQNRSTSMPFMVDELISELLARGGHHTDIADAFYAANPNWLSK